MKIEIKHKYSGEILFKKSRRDNSLKLTLELAVSSYADLRSADLSFANLRSANLRSADLSSANLRSANLRSADLSSANLRSADLSFADLRSADLRSADLRYADLSFADLRYAVGNGRYIKSCQVGEYRVVYTSEHMWIGCRKHPVKTWWEDSEKDIEKLSKENIQWRKDNKRWIKAMVKAQPAEPTGFKEET